MCYIYKDTQKSSYIQNVYWVYDDYISLLSYERTFSVPSRVFDAFFTTTSPASFGAPTDEQMVGTGLGLKIVKDIIVYYKGKIYLVPPENNFSTCFRIELPKQ